MAPYLSQLGKFHAASSVVCTGMAEGVSSSLALSYSHCPASTSCLVDPPILPAWPISVLLKYMIDRIQTILPHQCPLGEHYPSASGQVVGSIQFIRGKSRRILICPLRRDHLYPQSFRLIILNWGHNYNVMIIIKLTRVSSLLFLLSIGLSDLPQQKGCGLTIHNV